MMKRKLSRVVIGILLGLSLILGSWILLGRAVLAAPGNGGELLVEPVAVQLRLLSQPYSKVDCQSSVPAAFF